MVNEHWWFFSIKVALNFLEKVSGNASERRCPETTVPCPKALRRFEIFLSSCRDKTFVEIHCLGLANQFSVPKLDLFVSKDEHDRDKILIRQKRHCSSVRIIESIRCSSNRWFTNGSRSTAKPWDPLSFDAIIELFGNIRFSSFREDIVSLVHERYSHSGSVRVTDSVSSTRWPRFTSEIDATRVNVLSSGRFVRNVNTISSSAQRGR